MGYIRKQWEVIRHRDPAIKRMSEVFLYPCFYAILAHKVAHKLYKKKYYFTARILSQLARGLTGIEIHPGAIISEGLFIDHGMGVVIGETCEIGKNVTIYQGVTLGGTGKDTGKRHPTIGNNVMIGVGAKVLGPFKVGDNSRIAANAVVLQEVPPDSTVVGIPGRVVKRLGERIDPCSELDQVKIPDPVKMEICKLRGIIEEMQQKIDHLQQQLQIKEDHTNITHDMGENCLQKEICSKFCIEESK